jgi:hypothetical protein
MNSRILAVLALFCVSAAVPSHAAKKPCTKCLQKIAGGTPGESLKPSEPPQDDVNLSVEVSARYLDLEGKTRFVAGNATQVNYVTGGDKAFLFKSAKAEGVEFKKTGFIVNVLPVVDPNDGKKVSMQVQVELSGPSKGVQTAGGLVPDVVTWQWQSGFTLPLGKKTVLVDGPAYLEMTVARTE